MSKYQFKLPALGEGITEGTVGEWHVKPGDTVEADGDLVQIENDKSVEEIPSPVAGKVVQILVPEGETAEVDQPLIELEVEGDVPDDAKPSAPDTSASTQPQPTPQNTPAQSQPTPPLAPQDAPTQPTATNEVGKPADHTIPVLAMPAVRAYARDKGVDLSAIAGSGRHGQVTRADVDQALSGQPAQMATPTATSPVTATTTPANADAQWPKTVEKMSPVRKATAKAMVKSVGEIPHVHLFDEVVVDQLWDHRAKYKVMAADQGVHLTFLAYVVKALAVILKEFPAFNSSVDMANQTISYKDYINVGVATDTDHGLFVPNIKHADQMSLFNIARTISENTEKAKAGQIKPADMQHTSMSITNIGSVGGGFFTPVINWPEVAILGIGRITPEPIVVDGELTVGRVLKLSLGFDHRVIDGATAQKAMNRLKELLSDPERLLMEG